jgi:hypothetical protein
MMAAVNLTKIYCEHFVNVTTYPQYINNVLTKFFVKKLTKTAIKIIASIYLLEEPSTI